MKIHSVFYVKKKDNKIFLFDFLDGSREGLSQVIKFSDENNLDYSIDGLEWVYKGVRYNLPFQKKDYANAVFNNDLIFVCYQLGSNSFTIPNNLVIYSPTVQIMRILPTPLLPNGKRAMGFFQVWKLESKNISIPDNFKLGVGVTVGEHERSEWLYQYLFNPNTNEFLFINKFRY